ncbi:hypothetical protein O181_076439 [Austropuccinia psidii MF-1]|uniref:Reverse transcriptase Ty1/copia-type domain-containing protein n=1 Tax=Austropuccinia psidii MF-1 TaxID=1389203 RepID=A0A9Q3IFE3_9BASI|nr:hypothetical protein [Austropuccinia psidii MF-1]
MKVLGSKWVFTSKQDANGKVNKDKAHYVVKGLNQQPGQDFVDCYAPTPSIVTICLLLALKTQQKLHMTTFEISVACLHSPIDKEIYVKAPTELQPELKGKSMKLHKALNGTKQAICCWWLFFKSPINDMGLMVNNIRSSLYLYKQDWNYMLVWMHVDDGVILTNNKGLLQEIQSHMNKKLTVELNSNPDKIAGLNLKIGENSIQINQNPIKTLIICTYPWKVLNETTPLPTLSTSL